MSAQVQGKSAVTNKQGKACMQRSPMAVDNSDACATIGGNCNGFDKQTRKVESVGHNLLLSFPGFRAVLLGSSHLLLLR